MLGIFDSGIGGLTVVKELLKRHSGASFVYLGDTARTPYGNKSPDTIIEYALEDAAFLVTKGATVIVIACNTASSYAADVLRATYPDIPVFDVIQPAVDAAAAMPEQCIGIIGTKATIASGVYETRLRAANPDLRAVSAACPLFVPLVEEGWTDRPETETIARVYLAPLLEKSIESLILGCTHYPLLFKVIRKVVGDGVSILDSPSALLDHMERELSIPEGGEQNMYFTDNNEYARYFRDWFGRPFVARRADIDSRDRGV
ncbi:MAG: glutamate racemase [Candidatus Uhrbacteria bacterium]|uniref:Glutamate racemase n=1 Tax=candidate division WWE3 bacterium TaxID=2053526 RepID=A0A928TWB4_UNCKA|nr:glutamate racemase [candidate division WWE3 bacterium]RIL00575.1 MAG: glutamate racemase [Candidatus Uhrbacteria bacterium]